MPRGRATNSITNKRPTPAPGWRSRGLLQGAHEARYQQKPARPTRHSRRLVGRCPASATRRRGARPRRRRSDLRRWRAAESANVLRRAAALEKLREHLADPVCRSGSPSVCLSQRRSLPEPAAGWRGAFSVPGSDISSRLFADAPPPHHPGFPRRVSGVGDRAAAEHPLCHRR